MTDKKASSSPLLIHNRRRNLSKTKNIPFIGQLLHNRMINTPA